VLSDIIMYHIISIIFK